MDQTNKLRHDLHRLCRYKALAMTRYYLVIMLLLLTLYTGYWGISLVPFYLCAMVTLLPFLLLDAFKMDKELSKNLTSVIRSLNYTNKKYQGLRATFALTLALLLLWSLQWMKHPPVDLWLKFSPAILIISSLTIYTIGQYYYFHKFHELIMSNRMDEIH